MKTARLVVLLFLPTLWLHAADDPLAVKDSATIVRELTKPVLIPKGVNAKSARVIKREAQRVSLPAIRFKLDSTELADAESRRQLAELGKALAAGDLQGTRFTLEGHTCDLGNDTYNLGLSQRRAEAVRGWLEKDYGIAQSRIVVEGKGEDSPEVPNDSETHRAQNRRVVVIREP